MTPTGTSLPLTMGIASAVGAATALLLVLAAWLLTAAPAYRETIDGAIALQS